jgi:outer membrane immunogenic protein
MQKIVVAAVLAATLGSVPALAADIVRIPAAPAARIVAAPPFTWSGCYVGANIGYGFGRDTNGFGALIDGGFPDRAFELGPYNHNTSGIVAGGQLGCNHQGDSNLVIGVEGDLSWSGISGSHTVAEDSLPGGDPGTYTEFKSQNLWDGDVALRLGIAHDRGLFYGKAGIAWAGFRYAETHDDFSCPGGGSFCTMSFTNTRPGLLLGVGWEEALSGNWSFKIEYNYLNFGSATIPYPVGGTPTFKVSDTKQLIKIGLNYRLGSL